jgi:hypothetical protein
MTRRLMMTAVALAAFAGAAEGQGQVQGTLNWYAVGHLTTCTHAGHAHANLGDQFDGPAVYSANATFEGVPALSPHGRPWVGGTTNIKIEWRYGFFVYSSDNATVPTSRLGQNFWLTIADAELEADFPDAAPSADPAVDHAVTAPQGYRHVSWESAQVGEGTPSLYAVSAEATLRLTDDRGNKFNYGHGSFRQFGGVCVNLRNGVQP